MRIISWERMVPPQGIRDRRYRSGQHQCEIRDLTAGNESSLQMRLAESNDSGVNCQKFLARLASRMQPVYDGLTGWDARRQPERD